MRNLKKTSMAFVTAALAAGVFGVVGAAPVYAPMGVGTAHAQMGDTQKVTLSGTNEVPPVQSSGSASGEVTVKPDGSVSGTVKVSGFTPTAAHIHVGAAGANGPVAVPMTKQGEDTFVFPANAKLSPEQMQAFKAGNTYVNVHSAAHPGGEVRAQLKGGM